MPNYNGDFFLEKSILAFLNCTFDNKELIIVDGKSTDSSHKIIRKYSEINSCIKWVQEPDKGISDAINIGYASCEGEIIGYLGSDDLIRKGTLDLVAEYKDLIDFDAIYFDSYTYDFASNKVSYRKCPNIFFSEKNLLSFGTIVGLQNIFFSSRIFEEFKFDVDNRYSMDYEFYLRVLSKYSNFLYVNIPSTVNIMHENISSRLNIEQSDEAFVVAKKYADNVFLHVLKYKSKRFFRKLMSVLK